MVVEVSYLTWTEDGLLRQVVYLGEREDKPVAEVRRRPPAVCAAIGYLRERPPSPDGNGNLAGADVVHVRSGHLHSPW